jgi:ferritin
MKIKKPIEKAINAQIQLELASAYAYLSMAAYFDRHAFSGFAHWMRLQQNEENEHAMRFFNYLHDRDGRVELQPLEKPPHEFKSPLDVFEQSLENERTVTASIHRLYELAQKEKDHATVSMLKWFVDEQVEEEKSALDMVDKLKLAGDHPGALLLIDREAGARSDG